MVPSKGGRLLGDATHSPQLQAYDAPCAIRWGIQRRGEAGLSVSGTEGLPQRVSLNVLNPSKRREE